MTAALTRREAIRLLAAQIPFALAACSRPDEEIVPYVVVPEGMEPGVPLRFASVLPLSGRGRGVIVTSINGRPTKIEGNPHHPASLGATDAFAEAEILTLYDPDRSQVPLSAGRIASWAIIEAEIHNYLSRLGTGGDGLAVLTGRVASPTLEAQMQALHERLPQARWFAYDPLDDGSAEAGLRLAGFGTARPLPDLTHADKIVSFDSDFLGPGPDQIRLARSYADRRLAPDKPPVRLIALEASSRQTGAKADERYACSPIQMLEVLIELANGYGAGLRPAILPPRLDPVMQTLRSHLLAQGTPLILVGNTVSAEGHAIAHWLNQKLNASLHWVDAHQESNGRHPETLADLVAAFDRNEIKWVAAVGCNPAYDGPKDLDLPRRLGNSIPLLHAGLYRDETAASARWHLPLSHPLECWSDMLAIDGTAAICQPLVRPLYASRSLHELVAMLGGDSTPSGYDLVRATWRGRAEQDFDRWWNAALARGTIENTRYPTTVAPQASLPDKVPEPQKTTLTLVLRPDPCLYDGTYANNAWLQELPKPLSKQVWGHALEMSAADAKRLFLSTGDLVRVEAGEANLTCAVAITNGQAEGVIALSLGLGRMEVGAIGKDIGSNAFQLRQLDQNWTLPNIRLTPTGQSERILVAQQVVGRQQLDIETLRKRFPTVTEVVSSQPSQHASLYPERPRPTAEHAWGMVIDTARCIGCNACMVACQSENNIPVVGPEEIDVGRQMHWLRVDVYDRGMPDAPTYGFQPVPCMHCEKAPCEPVCPVAASVHDGEGLNVQVYNRCIGTRFCEANCPYKVRRFNFKAYADGQEFANLGDTSYRAQKNPDVTVRTRGVMEKCTYCIQRVSAARRQSERDNIPIPRDSVVTACQSACPTRAITFGDLIDAGSTVSQLKRSLRHYTLLEDLDTRPRTTYLAEVRDFTGRGLEGKADD